MTVRARSGYSRETPLRQPTPVLRTYRPRLGLWAGPVGRILHHQDGALIVGHALCVGLPGLGPPSLRRPRDCRVFPAVQERLSAAAPLRTCVSFTSKVRPSRRSLSATWRRPISDRSPLPCYISERMKTRSSLAPQPHRRPIPSLSCFCETNPLFAATRILQMAYAQRDEPIRGQPEPHWPGPGRGPCYDEISPQETAGA